MSAALQDLLLELLEARQLVVTHRALVDYHGGEGTMLLQSGLLDAVSYESMVVADDGDDVVSYKVGFDAAHQQYGYHHPHRGWTPVLEAVVERYSLSIERTLSLMFGDNLRRPVRGVLEIVPGLVWEVGQVRILKSALTHLWFARRLRNPGVQKWLADAVGRHSGAASNRVILTSTPAAGIPETFELPDSCLIPIAEVLDPYKTLQIDMGRLAGRFGGHKAASAVTGALHLSDDGSTLTILGAEITFSGALQRQAIRLLVAAHKAGKGENAYQLLQKAGYGTSVRTFRQAFKKQWPQLGIHLKVRNTLWRFEL
jgi:hypothetical protein